MIASLLSLIPWYWRWLAIVGAFVACFGYGFVKGVQHEEGNFNDFKADVDKTEAAALAVQVDRQRISKALIAQKDAEREQDRKDSDDFWAAYVAGLQLDDGAGPAKEPIRIAPGVCNDPARDNELSGAIEAARRATRAALKEYRRGIAPLLGAAEVQTGDLIDVQDWAAHEQLINHQP